MVKKNSPGRSTHVHFAKELRCYTNKSQAQTSGEMFVVRRELTETLECNAAKVRPRQGQSTRKEAQRKPFVYRYTTQSAIRRRPCEERFDLFDPQMPICNNNTEIEMEAVRRAKAISFRTCIFLRASWYRLIWPSARCTFSCTRSCTSRSGLYISRCLLCCPSALWVMIPLPEHKYRHTLTNEFTCSLSSNLCNQ